MVRLLVWVEQEDGGGGLLRVLEVADARLEALDVLAEELSPGLALAVIVLAAVALLGTNTLLTRGFRAVAALRGKKDKYFRAKDAEK